MNINKNELLRIIKIISTEIENNLTQTIEINKDYYWDLELDKMFDIDKDPSSYTMGQISDDWESIKRLLLKDEIPISYDLVRLAYILFHLRIESKGVW